MGSILKLLPQFLQMATKNKYKVKFLLKQLLLQLAEPLAQIPVALAGYQLQLSADNNQLIYTFDAQQDQATIAGLLRQLNSL